MKNYCYEVIYRLYKQNSTFQDWIPQKEILKKYYVFPSDKIEIDLSVPAENIPQSISSFDNGDKQNRVWDKEFKLISINIIGKIENL